MIIEGTWEEISSLSDKLSGRRVKLVVLLEGIYEDEENFDDEPPMTWEEWEADGDALAEEVAKVWPKGLTAVEAVNEQRRY